MRNIKIAVAVAASLAGGSAVAYNPISGGAPFVSSVVAGSSALRNGFANEMKNDFCAGAADYNTFISSSSDFRAFSCTLTSTSLVPSQLRNKTAVVYYRSEGGSFVGAGTVSGETPVVKRLLINASCTNGGAGNAYTCPVSGYCFTTDSGTGNLVNDTVELGVTDEEPTIFSGENLPDLTNSPFDTTNFISADVFNITATPAVAQGFAIAVNNTGDAGVAALTNLPSATVRAILEGSYSDWHQVPSPSGTGTVSATTGTTITVCRRDVGSGTQTMASIYFYGATCNAAAGSFGAPHAVVNNATSAMVTCLSTNKNSIGYLSFNNALTNAQYLSLDGVAPTPQNFTTGLYQFGSIASVNNPTTYTVSADDAALFNAILAVTQQASKLPAIGGTSGNGNNLAGLIGVAGNVKGNYSATAPVATFNNGGNSCSPIVNQ